jgi:hypothetical protein
MSQVDEGTIACGSRTRTPVDDHRVLLTREDIFEVLWLDRRTVRTHQQDVDRAVRAIILEILRYDPSL